MPMSFSYPFHMDFSGYSEHRLIKLSEDEVALSHLDRDDLLQLVSAMADKLRGSEDDDLE